jgi:isopenicillin-N N-acyltransferase-like protein
VGAIPRALLMPNQSNLNIIDVAGDHLQIGQQIGETCAPQIQQMLTTYRDLIATSYDRLKLNWDKAILQARKYQPFVAEYTPQYLRELEGMAQGAGVPLDDLMVLNCMEGIVNDALHLKCTSFAVGGEWTTNGHVLIGHNEDWSPEDENTVYLVRAHPENEPAYLALTYGGLIPNIGFNQHGIAQCCDSVYPNDSRLGIPRIFVARAVLACQTLSDALSTAVLNKRAAGYNHLIAHESGELYNIEVSAKQFSTQYAREGMIAHTNHYLDPRLQQIEHQPESLLRSHVRLNRAERLLRTMVPHSTESFASILSDHVNRPNSICCHDVDAQVMIERSKTIASIMIDLNEKCMYVALGSPCQSSYQRINLEG